MKAYRPFNSAEEVMEAIKEHGDWLKLKVTNNVVKIIAYNDTKVWYSFDCPGQSISKVFRYGWMFLDGTPFGKLEE